MKNEKGFTGLEIVAVLAIGFVAVTVLGPVLKPFIPGASGSGQTSTQKTAYKETLEPYTIDGKPAPHVQAQDGTELVLFKKTISNDTSDMKVTPPAPWYERLFMWFVHLGFLGLFIALAFPTVAVWGWAWITGRWKKLKETIAAEKAAHADTMTEARKVVISVDAGLDVFDRLIASANSAADSATQMAAATTDAKLIEGYQAIIATQNAVAKALAASKNSFLAAMSKKQDESTKLLVGKLKNGGLS